MSKNTSRLELLEKIDPANMRFIEGRSTTVNGSSRDILVMESDKHMVLITISVIEKAPHVENTQDENSPEATHAE